MAVRVRITFPIPHGSMLTCNEEPQPNKGSSREAVPQTTQGSQEQQQEQTRRDSKVFSLAGSQPNQPVAYVDPEYVQYNPHYNEENREPVWSLAQPLPRVVRPGMRPESATKDEDKEEQGKLSRDHQRPDPAAQEPPAEVPPSDEQEDRPEARVAQPDDRGFHNRWSKLRHYFRKELAEWFGTTVAMTLGLCASQSTYTSNNQAGTYPFIALTWGASYMIGIYVAGGISGGYFNPAITISMSIWRGSPPQVPNLNCSTGSRRPDGGQARVRHLPRPDRHDRSDEQSTPEPVRRLTGAAHFPQGQFSAGNRILHRVSGNGHPRRLDHGAGR